MVVQQPFFASRCAGARMITGCRVVDAGTGALAKAFPHNLERTALSSHFDTLIPTVPEPAQANCPATTTETFGFAVCSLPAGHSGRAHQWLDDDTGEPLHEWPTSTPPTADFGVRSTPPRSDVNRPVNHPHRARIGARVMLVALAVLAGSAISATEATAAHVDPKPAPPHLSPKPSTPAPNIARTARPQPTQPRVLPPKPAPSPPKPDSKSTPKPSSSIHPGFVPNRGPNKTTPTTMHPAPQAQASHHKKHNRASDTSETSQTPLSGPRTPPIPTIPPAQPENVTFIDGTKEAPIPDTDHVPAPGAIGTIPDGWWQDWGKCTAGIVGGAGAGATAGALGGEAAGAVMVPVIGSVPGAVIGAAGGIVFGGLSGAAASC